MDMCCEGRLAQVTLKHTQAISHLFLGYVPDVHETVTDFVTTKAAAAETDVILLFTLFYPPNIF